MRTLKQSLTSNPEIVEANEKILQLKNEEYNNRDIISNINGEIILIEKEIAALESKRQDLNTLLENKS